MLKFLNLTTQTILHNSVLWERANRVKCGKSRIIFWISTNQLLRHVINGFFLIVIKYSERGCDCGLHPPLITNHASKDNLWTSDTTQHQQETTYLGAWLNITVYYLQEASEHHQTSFTCLLSAHNNHIINPGWVLASGGHQVCALLLGSIFLHASSRWRWISGDWSGGVQSLSVHCPIKRFP